MNKPRVLFVDQSGALGGAELMLLDLAKHYRDRCHVAVLSDGPFIGKLRQAEIETSIVPLGMAAMSVQKDASLRSSFRALPNVWNCALAISRISKHCDVIYANTQKALVVSKIASLLGRKPIIFHLHDLLTASHFSKLNRKVAVNLMNRCDAVVSNSLASEAAYLRSGGRPRRRRVVYNGFNIDADSWKKTPELEASSNTEVQQTLRIGVFGRLTPWKGQDVLIEAMKHLSDVSLSVIMVGDALYTAEDVRYADRLRASVAEGCLSERVQFLGHRDDVSELMHSCDIIVHTSTQPEPFGRVIVEGMLAGKPVVATDAGGTREIINDGVDGLLVPPSDIIALANTLRKLAHDPAMRVRLAKTGQITASKRFAMSHLVAGVDEVISDVVSKH